MAIAMRTMLSRWPRFRMSLATTSSVQKLMRPRRRDAHLGDDAQILVEEMRDRGFADHHMHAVAQLLQHLLGGVALVVGAHAGTADSS